MNLILLQQADVDLVWPVSDPKAQHVLKILRMKAGDTFFVGLENGPRGKAHIVSLDKEKDMRLKITWEQDAPKANQTQLLVGLPRPQTSRRVLFEAAVFGIERLIFFQSDKGEPSYAQSSLWSSGEWKRHLRDGAEQAFSTTIPEIVHYDSLKAASGQISIDPRISYLALDVYEGESLLSSALVNAHEVMLALGAERGWSADERDLLRDFGFKLVSLGERVLKTETACVAAMSIAGAALKQM